MRLESKTALIIGAGQAPGESTAIGNGRATALVFAREGAKVCCVDRYLETAEETAKMIAKDGIFFLPGKLGAISDAHTRSDIKAMKKATESFVSDLKK